MWYYPVIVGCLCEVLGHQFPIVKTETKVSEGIMVRKKVIWKWLWFSQMTSHGYETNRSYNQTTESVKYTEYPTVTSMLYFAVAGAGFMLQLKQYSLMEQLHHRIS